MLRDGTGFLQCVAFAKEVPAELFERCDRAALESSLVVRGNVRKDDRAPGGFELGLADVQVVHEAAEYPIQPKEHGVEFLFDNRHLYLRSRTPQSVLRVRNEVVHACRQFFYDRDFVLAHPRLVDPKNLLLLPGQVLPRLEQVGDRALTGMWTIESDQTRRLFGAKSENIHIARIEGQDYVFVYRDIAGLSDKMLTVGAYFPAQQIYSETESLRNCIERTQGWVECAGTRRHWRASETTSPGIEYKEHAGIGLAVLYDEDWDAWEFYGTRDLERLAARLEAADEVVGYNSVSYDHPVLDAALGRRVYIPNETDLWLAIREARRDAGDPQGSWKLDQVARRRLDGESWISSAHSRLPSYVKGIGLRWSSTASGTCSSCETSTDSSGPTATC